MGSKHTMEGRAQAELADWLEHEHLKGAFALVGNMWGRHPAWGDDPDSDTYQINRWRWHQNLGELLDYHGTCHVQNEMRNGITRKRLVLTLNHPDPTRLEAVKAVAGGTVEAHEYARGTHRLRIKDKAAFLAVKCGRLFVDRANLPLFEVLNAAGLFYTAIPDPGVASNETQISAQEYYEKHLIELLKDYTGQGRRDHDCTEQIEQAGGGPPRKASVF